MKLVPKRIADYVSVPWDERRTEKVWSSLQAQPRARLGPASRASSLARAALVSAAAVLLVFVVLRRFGSHRASDTVATANPPSMQGRVIDTHGAMQPVQLPDGSTLLLEAESRLWVLSADGDRVRLRLENGSVDCNVAHRPARTFVVEVGGGEVAVRGTRFRVTAARNPMSDHAGGWHVRVEQGSVEVRRSEREPSVLLRAGAFWSSEPQDRPAEPATAQPAEVAPTLQGVAEPTPRARPSQPTARELFSRADSARSARRHEEAASYLAQLVRRFPRDPRAPLAAFQLGRIRLLTLHQHEAAIQAFSFVLEHRTRSPFFEDAEAARVEAADKLGDRARCVAWRDQFLEAHRRSASAERVRRMCAR